MKAERAFAAAVLLAVACLVTPSGAQEAPAESYRLTVRIVGLESNEGAVALALFDTKESFKSRTDPVDKGFVPIEDGSSLWVVSGLSPGQYAVAAYHDINANQKLDKRPHGPPKEPYGFSNNARATFGPPGYSKAMFEIDGDLTIEIDVH